MGKTIFRGARRLRDEATGEIIDTEVVERTLDVGDAGFHKIWLGHILELVEEVGNAKMQVLVWLLKQADAQNQIAGSFEKIATGAGVSVRTTHRLLQSLLAANVIARDGRYGLWRLNPDVIFKGGRQARMNVLIRYRDEKQGDLFDDSTDHKAAPLRLVA